MNTATASNQLAQRQSVQFDLSPQTFDQALEFSKYLASSEMVPKQYRGKPGDCLIAMQWGYEIGMKPLQALQSIAAINGKPSVYGDAGKAMLLAAGCEIDEDDTEMVRQTGRARCKITRPGRKPVERTFSLEDAKAARLWGKDGPWTNYPYRQMAWRAFWFAARDAAADLLKGMGGTEEMQDMAQSTAKPSPSVTDITPDKQPYPQADFEANLPTWKSKIDKGTAADRLIQFIHSRNATFEMTADQQATLKNYKPAAEVVTDVEPKEQPSQDAPAVDASKLEADHEGRNRIGKALRTRQPNRCRG